MGIREKIVNWAIKRQVKKDHRVLEDLIDSLRHCDRRKLLKFSELMWPNKDVLLQEELRIRLGKYEECILGVPKRGNFRRARF